MFWQILRTINDIRLKDSEIAQYNQWQSLISTFFKFGALLVHQHADSEVGFVELWISHPASMSASMMSRWPASTARWSGVTPLIPRTVIWALTIAPFATRRRTMSVWPFCAARWSAVTLRLSPRLALRCTSTLASMRSLTMVRWPCWAASVRGVELPTPGELKWQSFSMSLLHISVYPFHAAMCIGCHPC